MLYDPYGEFENGVITLKPETDKLGHDLVLSEWISCKGGLYLEQNGDVIVLDADQVEALYSIIKHNR